jgi:hypothetical protein
MVLPQTTLGQISIAPWTDQPPTQGKKGKKLSNNNNKKDYQRGWGVLSAEEWEKGNPSQQAGWRRQEWRHMPSNQEQESL